MESVKMEKEILNVAINDVIPNRFQPRLSFDDGAMQELAQSISEHGIIQPLVVRRVANKFEIIAGERRYKAATMAGVATIPVIVFNLSDNESAEVALIENIQRRDLTPIEEAKSYQNVLDMTKMTQDNLAKRLGKSQAFIANKVRLLTLSSMVQTALMNNEISERHARSLLSVKNEDDQIKLLNRIKDERLTVRKTDKMIEEYLNEKNQSNSIYITPNPSIFDGVESLEVESPSIISPINNANILTQSAVTPLNQSVTTEKPSLDFLLRAEDESPKVNNASPIETGDILSLPSATDIQKNSYTEVLNDPMLKPDLPLKEIEAEMPVIINKIINDYRSVITAIRANIKDIQKQGINITSEEFDFEDFFQINIKLDKK